VSGWHGVDLDGTLAEYHGWVGRYNIGAPIPAMVERVKKWLKDGEEVKVFTARAKDKDPKVVRAIQRWCRQHVGVELDVVCEKDYGMIDLWDDRAVQVIPNTGEAVQDLVLLLQAQLKAASKLADAMAS
jgi:hypothetical protein